MDGLEGAQEEKPGLGNTGLGKSGLGKPGLGKSGLGETGLGETGWDRFDWFWSGLAVMALALAASFVVNIYQAVSIGGITVAGIFATMIQAMGVALLGSGVFSSAGQARFKTVLSSLGVPPRFHGRSVFVSAALLLASVALLHSWLDEHYFQKGARLYQEGDLKGAATAYLQGIHLNPSAPKRRTELGEVYESLGERAEAIKNYHDGVKNGDPLSLNNMGRVSVEDSPELSEAYLLLGLQRLETQEDPDPALLYQLHRNIGWALMHQKKFDLAESYLRQAIVLDQVIQIEHAGEGMAYCFLAQNSVLKEDPVPERLWRSCLEEARPEFIHEYQWFIEIGRDDLAYCLDSSQVVGGFEGRRGADPVKDCDELFRAEVFAADG